MKNALFRCPPHFGLGIVALIVVGTPENVEDAKAVKVPAKPQKVFLDLFAQLSATQ